MLSNIITYNIATVRGRDKMPKINNEPSILDDEKVTINRNAIEHRATWMGLSYEAAKESGVDGI